MIALIAAQDPALPVPAVESSEQLDEVIVTAQRREQRLQDVPVVVTVLSQEALENAGVRDIKDLTQLTSGLIVTSTFSDTSTTARIRGVGTVGDNPGLESSVGVVIDGVYRPRNGVGFGDLGELERIEVLKGPQGTLFGKNTSAGLISIVSQRPSFTPEAGFETTIGNYEAFGASGYVTGPIIEDRLAGRLFASARRRDGFLDIETGGGPRQSRSSSDQSYETVRGQLYATPSERFDARLIVDYTRRDEDCCIGVALNRPPTASLVDAAAGAPSTAPTPAPFERVGYANRSTRQKLEDRGISLEVTVEDVLPGTTLTSLTSYRLWDSGVAQDSDFGTADLFYRPDDLSYEHDFRTLTQEVRLAGGDEQFNWLVGAIYGDEQLDRYDRLELGQHFERYASLLLSNGANANFVPILTGRAPGTSFVPGEGMRDDYQQTSESIALFTHNEWQPIDSVTFTLGLRFTHEEKAARAEFDNTNGAPACTAGRARQSAGVWSAIGLTAAQQQQALGFLCMTFWNPAFNDSTLRQSRTEEEWSGTAKAAWRPQEDILTYLSFSRGYKAGGFNLDRTQTGLTPDTEIDFPGEFVDSWEVGAKSTLADGRLNLNAALFHQRFTDFQLNTYLGTTYVVRSVPEVVSQGVDLDVLYRMPETGLTLQAGVTYADTKYGPDLVPGLPLLPNQQISFAPLWSSTASLAYERPIGALLATASVSVKYNSRYNTGSDLGPTKDQDAFALVTARVGVGPQDGSWSLEAWAQNLFDEEYTQVAYDAAFQPGYTLAFLGAPRTFGVTLRGRF